MTKIENCVPVQSVIQYLPGRLAVCLRIYADKYPERAEQITEVRLRAGGMFSLSLSDENVFPVLDGCRVTCTPGEVEQCVMLLCRRSYQSHQAEIENGYISVDGGVRVGVAYSRAPGGEVHTVNAVCIRIPREIECDISPVFARGVRSSLIYSPPGVGKTTALRLCIKKLCEMRLRVSVIDTRFELSGMSHCNMADYICGCERGEGIEAAVRSLSPQVMVCDEIGTLSESGAILQAVNTGVPFIATAHAQSIEGLLRRPGIAVLNENRVFECYIGLSRQNGGFGYDITEAWG